jgi:hypothetical protein
MKLIGFELKEIYLKTDEEELDLHNNYDFVRFIFENKLRKLTLKWKRGKSDWIKTTLPKNLYVIISDVSYFSVMPRNSEIPYSEDDCLEYMGFVDPHNKSVDEFYTSDSLPKADWHYVFRFMSDFSIRVQAEQAICKIGNF